MQDAVGEALSAFVARYLAAVEARSGGLPVKQHEPEWPSACPVGVPGPDGLVSWQPVLQQPAVDLSGLARAMEVPTHPDLLAYFGSYWSETLPGRFDGDPLDLIQLWNADDAERLIENQLGHAVYRTRARRPLTWFFATVDEPDLLLSVHNESGAVLLERSDGEVLRQVEDSLAAFLQQVEPDPARAGGETG